MAFSPNDLDTAKESISSTPASKKVDWACREPEIRKPKFRSYFFLFVDPTSLGII